MPGYRKVYEVIGYACEAALHCVTCAQLRFGGRLRDHRDPPRDREGNPVAMSNWTTPATTAARFSRSRCG